MTAYWDGNLICQKLSLFKRLWIDMNVYFHESNSQVELCYGALVGHVAENIV